MNQPINKFKKLWINADDFAQSAAIDQAIIDLAKHQVISSTSALTLAPRWLESAKELKGLNIQIGLHLDLTSQFTHMLGYDYSLPKLIFFTYTRTLNKRRLKKMIDLQWNRFLEAYGQAPDFIDGHQHVHQLPMVRDALLLVISERKWGKKPWQWIRVCNTSHWRGFKAMVISLLGAKSLQRSASEMGIATNSDFAGVYHFNDRDSLKNNWESWLTHLSGNKPVIMCHVADSNKSNNQTRADLYDDVIWEARVNEYNWLNSKDFQLLLKSNNFSI